VDTCSKDMRKICETYNNRLFRVAYCITRDHYLAQDVVQETFIKAYLKMDMVEDEEKLGAWLSAIATRTAIDFIRKEKKINERSAMLADIENTAIKMDQNVEQEVEMNLLNEKIGDFIGTLSSDQKKVFLLKIKHGLKEKEIAEQLKINQNTVKTRIYRVRKQLKEAFVEQGLA